MDGGSRREENKDSMAGRTAAWGEMETDCLVVVFRRLATEDLAAAAPLVCRGWRRAAADPSLWRVLDLRHDHIARFMPWGALAVAFARRYGVARFTLAGFLRLCVARARGSLVDLALPPLLSSPIADLDRVSIDCTRLRRLALPDLSSGEEARLPELIPRWRLLQSLDLNSTPFSFPAVAAQLALHCPDFSDLKTSGSIKPEDAAAMAASLPMIRSLSLDESYLPKQELLVIFAGCKQLVDFSARNCVGFDEKDVEVTSRGTWIERFEIGGSRFVDELDDEMMFGDEFCNSYVDVM